MTGPAAPSTELAFAVLDISPEPYAVTPILTARVGVAAIGDDPVHALALRCQVRIEPARRGYTEQEAAGRASFLDGIVRKGKIPPAAKAGYASQLAQGGDVEKQTRAFLDSLPDNTIPVELRGNAADVDADETATASVTYTDDDGHLARLARPPRCSPSTSPRGCRD